MFHRQPSRHRYLNRTAAAVMTCVLSLATLPAIASPVRLQDEIPDRPATEQLLPETVVGLIQVDNFRDLAEKMKSTAGGQLMQDDAIAPLVDGLWEEAKSAYADVRDDVGVDLEDLQNLPAGEMTFAVIAPRRQDLAYMLMLDLNNETGALDRVLDRGREAIAEANGEPIESSDSEDGFVIETFRVDEMKVWFFRHDGMVIGCTSEDELNDLIDRWMGREVEKVRPLSANRKFVTIMNRCLGTNELKPEARFFIDPISLAKSATRGNFAAQATINFLPVLGLDGLLGIGGSMLLSEDEFESVVHGHILLSNPRSGILEMLAFKPTNYEPESWLPEDVTNYWTTSWDLNQMYVELGKILELAGNEGAITQFEEFVKQQLDLEFKEDILDVLDGRLTYIQWMERPLRINSNLNVIAIKLDDPEKAQATLDRIFEKANENSEPGSENVVATDYKGVTIWGEPQERIDSREQRRQERRQQRMAERGEEGGVDVEVNSVNPGVAIVGDTLIFSPQSRSFLEHAIDTERGEFPTLRDNEEFKNISNKMSKLLKNELPCAIFFQNPEESIRMLIELANSPNSKALMARGAEDNKYLAGIKRQLDDNPLPDFEALKRYFAKSGGFATSDDTGYHFLFFALKPELDE